VNQVDQMLARFTKTYRSKPKLSLKVHASSVDDGRTKASSLRCDQTESRRIKILSSINEVRMVQEIYRRYLQFQPDPFREWNAFDQT
jgi:hypothetical protein